MMLHSVICVILCFQTMDIFQGVSGHRYDDIVTFNHIQDTMAGRFGSSLQSLHNSTSDVIQAAALTSDWLNAIKSTPFNQSELLIQAIQDVSDVLSPECKQTLQAFLEDLWSGGKEYPYTLLALDAFGKFPSGFAEGDMHWWGTLEECRKIEGAVHAIGGQKHVQFVGKSCFSPTLFLISKTDTPLVNLGLCVPTVCSESNITALGNALINRAVPGRMYVTSTICSDKPPLDVAFYVCAVVLCCLVFLIMLGTFCDVFITLRERYRYVEPIVQIEPDDCPLLGDDRHDGSPEQVQLLYDKQSKLMKMILCFSLIRNCTKLLSVSHGGEEYLRSLNGIRVISMFWVILGHSILSGAALYKNPLTMLEVIYRFTFQAILNATFSVDSFFFLSGLLVCFLTLKQLQLRRLICAYDWLYFYGHRFWRLTPMYAFVILTLIGFLPQMIDGPFTKPVLKVTDTCNQYWWANLLYINNFVPNNHDKMCFSWGWYLANDMQFYVLSPIYIYLLHRSRYLGQVAVGVTIVASVTATGIVARIHHQTPILMGGGNPAPPAENKEYQTLLYFQPWYRLQPYFVGIMVGYIFHRTKGRFDLHWILVVVGWCLSAAAGLSLVYGLYYNYQKGSPLDDNVAALYISCSRCVWAMCLGWVCFACGHGYAGPINTFLSWSFWSPLSRLTYAAYLIHPIIITVFYMNSRVPLYYTDINTAFLYMAHLLASYVLAIAVSLLVESPMMALDKLIFRK